MIQPYHIAQVNIARMKAPLDDPVMARFAAQLDPMNQLADESPGFVWRLQSDEGDSTAIRVFDDENMLINLTVWDSIEALHHYVYKSPHRHPLRSRRDWFHPIDGPMLALWWIPSGHIPTPEEAKEKLDLIARIGPTREAFTFAQPFSSPGSEEYSREFLDRFGETCET
jgi:hypothetical protein